MLAWKDTTSYSQGDKDRTPNTWSASAGAFRLVITKGHIHHKGQWVMHVYPGLVDTAEMDVHPNTLLEIVQQVAEDRLRAILMRAAAALV